jgi:hypothetical protein
MFDVALLAKGGADEADRVTAVALNFEIYKRVLGTFILSAADRRSWIPRVCRSAI